MRASFPRLSGLATNPTDGVKVFYEVFGPEDAERTLMFLPMWAITHSRSWKLQVPCFVNQGFRVITMDHRGNGKSDRPETGYTLEATVQDVVAVLDELKVERCAMVAKSAGARWGSLLAANHAERVTHLAMVAVTLPLVPGQPPASDSERFRRFKLRHESPTGYDKYNAHHWRTNFRDFLDFFVPELVSEPHSTKQIDDITEYSQETTGEILARTVEEAGSFDALDALGRIRCPLLAIHGSDDPVIPVAVAHRLKELRPDAQVHIVEGGGHSPEARDPVKVNLLISEFIGPARTGRLSTWRRAPSRKAKRALFVSSPIGLGHVLRDVAIARALRAQVPGLQIDWLSQHPVTGILERRGETVHPVSQQLSIESAHLEEQCGEHDLNAFLSYRKMDEILTANFHSFHSAVSDGSYDLWIADEGWEIDYFLHENPELKRAPFAWLTDFVGWLPNGADEERLTTSYNAQMLEQIDRFTHVRDRSIFVGNPRDVIDVPFGPGLPSIRDWTTANFSFPGYVQYIERATTDVRQALRHELGYRDGERVIVVAVGGTGVGKWLLSRIIESFPMVERRVPGARMIVVAGPRIDPASLNAPRGVEVHGYVDNLYRHFAACDLALVQGGLSSTMELVSFGTPFLYFPLRNHFEQNFHVPLRLANYGVPPDAKVDAADTHPEALADRIARTLDRAPTSLQPVESDGAERVARSLAELL